MKKILVPCDFSDSSVHAFKLALEIAQQSKGEVFVLNVMDMPIQQDTMIMPTLYFEQNYMKEMKESIENKFSKIKDKWAQEKQSVSLTIEFGTVTNVVNEFVAKKNIDLVLMGTQGVTGTKEFLIGSNTEKIVRTSKVPVISIKKALKIANVKDIVFANDIDLEAEKLILEVKELQSFFKAKLHLLFVNTPSSFRRDVVTHKAMKEFAKRMALKDYTLNVFNDLDQESGVWNFVKSINADMVAMATHGRRGISRILSGSIAEDIVNHLDCPVWTSRIEDK